MYYITKRDSETGKKFASFREKMKRAFQEQREMCNKYGFSHWRAKSSFSFGGISGVQFPNGFDIDMKVWKSIGTAQYYPRLTSKIGKLIHAEFEAMFTVEKDELNACIGYNEIMNTIGFAFNNDEYFGFAIGKNWDVKIPDDCEEVLHSKYLELFKRKNDDQAHPSPQS